MIPSKLLIDMLYGKKKEERKKKKEERRKKKPYGFNKPSPYRGGLISIF